MQNLTAGSQNLFGSEFRLPDARGGTKPARIADREKQTMGAPSFSPYLSRP